MRIRFYDNDPSNFNGIGPNLPPIECILVDDDQPNVLIQPIIEQYERVLSDTIDGRRFPRECQSVYSTLYLRRYPQDAPYLQVLFRGNPIARTTVSLPCQGINDAQIVDLLSWCTATPNEQKIVFFDWDRTISVLEGFFALPQTFPVEIRRSYLVYILGGPERYQRLVSMFQILRQMNVEIYILTNNDSLLSQMTRQSLRARGLRAPVGPCRFNEALALMQFVDPELDAEHLIAAAEFRPNVDSIYRVPAKSNKTVALENLLWRFTKQVKKQPLFRIQQQKQRQRQQQT